MHVHQYYILSKVMPLGTQAYNHTKAIIHRISII